MASWPENNNTDWNTKMRSFLDQFVSLTTGVLKKASLLSALEWTPTAYVNGESETYPNGKIRKTGSVSFAASAVVAFDDDFPNAINVNSIQVQTGHSSAGQAPTAVTSESVSGFTIKTNGSGTTLRWVAEGY